MVVFLTLRILDQDRQLVEKHAQEDRRRRLTQLHHDLLLSLPRRHDAVALTGIVRDNRLLLPWETNRPRLNLLPAEREEFTSAQPARALDLYRAALVSSPHPAQQAYARLLLARALTRLHRPAEAAREYQRLLHVPLDLTDEHGVPFAFYAATRTPHLDPSWLRSVLDRLDLLSPEALYLLRSLAPQPAIDNRLRDLEQAEALQRDFPKLAPLLQSSDPVYVPYGNPLWLLTLASDRLLALRAQDVLASFAARPDPQGESLGDTFSGLRVAFSAPPISPPSRRPLLLASLALVLALTLFATWLLWRDLHRESQVADLRSQFVAGVSHELKSPVAAIRMFTENLRTEDDLDPETRRDYVETIWHEAERLSRLVDNVLEFSRIDQGRRTYHLRPTSLHDVVTAAAQAVDHTLTQSGFHLDLSADPDLPPIPADRDALHQAVLNLLTNAMKYSGDSRQIALRLARDDNHALIQVTDQGIGIPLDEQPRIFDRFYRGRDTQDQRIPGTGLGLTLVKYIAAAHGGQVHVQSSPGQGSIFTLALPL